MRKKSKFRQEQELLQLKEIIAYVNRLELEEGQAAKSYLTLIAQNSFEPGVTTSELSAFNAGTTEDYGDFLDRQGEFFNESGLHIACYADIQDIYLIVTEPANYRKFLKNIKNFPQDIQTSLMRKVERGLEFQIDSAYVTVGGRGDASRKELDELVKQKYDALFKSIPIFLERHSSVDSDPPPLVAQIRKRLYLKMRAYKNNHLHAFLLLDEYLSIEEMGTKSRIEYLSDVMSLIRERDLWDDVLDRLNLIVSLYSKKAQPIFDRVLSCLVVAMDDLQLAKVNYSKPLSVRQEDMFRYKTWLYATELARLQTVALPEHEKLSLRERRILEVGSEIENLEDGVVQKIKEVEDFIEQKRFTGPDFRRLLRKLQTHELMK